MNKKVEYLDTVKSTVSGVVGQVFAIWNVGENIRIDLRVEEKMYYNLDGSKFKVLKKHPTNKKKAG